MDHLLDPLRTMPIAEVGALLLLANAATVGLALAGGHLLVRRFGDQRVAPPPDPIDRFEAVLALSCLLLNTGVTIAAFLLWRRGVVRFRADLSARVLIDSL